MAVHGFRFAPSIDGMVITVPQQALLALLGGQDGWRDAVLRLQALSTLDGDLLPAAQALRDEHGAAQNPWRRAALDTGLRRLLLALARSAPPPAPAADAALPPRALQHVRRFQALVDAQFRRQPALASLAAPLGITPTQLNRVCHRVLGHSALGVLHARLLLEAQRELGYTAMSVKQVAIGLGFADAGYFTRFFQRLTGQTPTGFRERVHLGRPISSPQPSSSRTGS
jgi:AraC family transcriptional activator of pobA